MSAICSFSSSTSSSICTSNNDNNFNNKTKTQKKSSHHVNGTMNSLLRISQGLRCYKWFAVVIAVTFMILFLAQFKTSSSSTYIKTNGLSIDRITPQYKVLSVEEIIKQEPTDLYNGSRNNHGHEPNYLDSDSTTTKSQTNADYTNRAVKTLPNLVFHVGPPKTATTSTQVTLCQWNNTGILLEKDNYIYFGKVPEFLIRQSRYHNNYNNNNIRNNKKDNTKPILRREQKESSQIIKIITNRTCHEEMSKVRGIYYKENNYTYYYHPMNERNDSTRNTRRNVSLYETLLQIPCAKNIVNTLYPYSIMPYRRNILISDEMMSRGYQKWTTLPTKTTRTASLQENVSDATTSNSDDRRTLITNDNNNNDDTNEGSESYLDWISLSVLLQSMYNITVIVGYRRYADWLPSMKQQLERYTAQRDHWNLWPLLQNNNDNTTGDSSITDNTTRIGGLLMEPLFPNYWRRVVPGQIVPFLSGWYYNEIVATSSKCQRTPVECYWGTILDIPSHYTDTTIRSLRNQQKELKQIYTLEQYHRSSQQQTQQQQTHEIETVTTTSTNTTTVSQPESLLLLNLNIVVFNLHELTSINNYTEPLLRSIFFCKALPDAPNLCLYSQMLETGSRIDTEKEDYEDNENNENNENNEGNDGDTDEDNDDEMEKREEKETVDSIHSTNPSRSETIYNQLVTAAYLAGMIPETSSTIRRSNNIDSNKNNDDEFDHSSEERNDNNTNRQMERIFIPSIQSNPLSFSREGLGNLRIGKENDEVIQQSLPLHEKLEHEQELHKLNATKGISTDAGRGRKTSTTSQRTNGIKYNGLYFERQSRRHKYTVQAQMYHIALLREETTSNIGTNSNTNHPDDEDNNTPNDEIDTYDSPNTDIIDSSRKIQDRQQWLKQQQQLSTLLEMSTEGNNQSKYAFPLICPNRTELEAFLNKSLQYEALLEDELYGSIDTGSSDNTVAIAIGKQRHLDDFWNNAYTRNKYCSIDTTAALQQQHWKDFFSHYNRSVAPHDE